MKRGKSVDFTGWRRLLHQKQPGRRDRITGVSTAADPGEGNSGSEKIPQPRELGDVVSR
jgi:hypothetical protein